MTQVAVSPAGDVVVAMSPAQTRFAARSVQLLVAQYRRDGFPMPREILELVESLNTAAGREPPGTDRSRQEPTEVAPAESPAHDAHALLSVRQAAVVLGMASRSVERLVTSGALPSLKIQGLRRIARTDLDRYIIDTRERKK